VQRSETDQDGDGKADILVSYSGGRKLSQSEDHNGDGEADFTVFFRAGSARRVEQDSEGRGCVNVIDWLDIPPDTANTLSPELLALTGRAMRGSLGFPTWGSFAPIQVNLTECLLSDIAKIQLIFPIRSKGIALEPF
jgi:hypothetical protein